MLRLSGDRAGSVLSSLLASVPPSRGAAAGRAGARLACGPRQPGAGSVTSDSGGTEKPHCTDGGAGLLRDPCLLRARGRSSGILGVPSRASVSRPASCSARRSALPSTPDGIGPADPGPPRWGRNSGQCHHPCPARPLGPLLFSQQHTPAWIDASEPHARERASPGQKIPEEGQARLGPSAGWPQSVPVTQRSLGPPPAGHTTAQPLAVLHKEDDVTVATTWSSFHSR
ncbi:uncharacterized protein AAEQ78_019632 [Lycaon pictus]